MIPTHWLLLSACWRCDLEYVGTVVSM